MTPHTTADPDAPCDADLAAGVLAGDERALRDLIERYRRPVFGVCLRMLGHRQDAEDTAQEVFVRLYRHLDRWDRDRPLRPWLMTITVNRCRTALSRRRRVPVPAELPDREGRGPVHDSELAEELQGALEILRDDYRAAFVLYHHQEFSCAEVAGLLDRPEGTIKTWLHRARRQLADHLSKRGVRPAADHVARPR